MPQLLSIILWNSALAAICALILLLLQRIRLIKNQPHVCHALWLLVLVRLLTPPLLTIPVDFGPSEWLRSTGDSATPISAATADVDVSPPAVYEESHSGSSVAQRLGTVVLTPGFALAVSGLGSLVFASFVLRKARLISRLIENTASAPDSMQQEVDHIVQQWNMKRSPAVRIISGRMSPFLWVSWRGPFIVLPQELAASLSLPALRLVLRHELAHLVRGDHISSGFATICIILFWWNPVVWWVRRELRIVQEQCCDQLVLAQNKTERIRYAETLLETVSFVGTGHATCPSPAASFGSCDTLKRRIEVIVTDNARPVKTWKRRLLILTAALTVLPVGMTAAQDYGAIERRLGKAVAKGEITTDQAKIMLDALRESDKRHRKIDLVKDGVAQRIAEIKQLVASGQISREDGARFIGETSQSQSDTQTKDRQRIQVEMQQRYNEISRQVRDALEAGHLSYEEAEKKMLAVREELILESSPAATESTDKLKAIKHRMKEVESQVEAGNLSEEEAAKLTQEMKRVFEAIAAQSRERQERAQVVEYRLREIEELVKSGQLSKQDAAKLIGENRDYLRGPYQKADDPRASHYRDLQREIEAAVKAEKISKKEAEKKLIEVRKKLFGEEK